MKKNKNVLKLIIVYVFMLNSCYNNAFNEILFRNINDPFDDVPKADSLSKEHTVYLSWQEDDAADKYYLMRSFDTVPLDWSCVYEGTATEYVDTNLVGDELYIYRLDKKRGSVRFEGKDYAYGFSADCRRDKYEPNDVDSSATPYMYACDCNLPCVRYQTNNKEILDYDWFAIKLPPRQTAVIVIKQNNFPAPHDSTYLKMLVLENGAQSKSVISGQQNLIHNPSYGEVTAYFKIFPETTGLLGGNRGIAIIEYTVSCNQWVEYKTGGSN